MNIQTLNPGDHFRLMKRSLDLQEDDIIMYLEEVEVPAILGTIILYRFYSFNDKKYFNKNKNFFKKLKKLTD